MKPVPSTLGSYLTCLASPFLIDANNSKHQAPLFPRDIKSCPNPGRRNSQSIKANSSPKSSHTRCQTKTYQPTLCKEPYHARGSQEGPSGQTGERGLSGLSDFCLLTLTATRQRPELVRLVQEQHDPRLQDPKRPNNSPATPKRAFKSTQFLPQKGPWIHRHLPCQQTVVRFGLPSREEASMDLWTLR